MQTIRNYQIQFCTNQTGALLWFNLNHSVLKHHAGLNFCLCLACHCHFTYNCIYVRKQWRSGYITYLSLYINQIQQTQKGQLASDNRQAMKLRFN